MFRGGIYTILWLLNVIAVGDKFIVFITFPIFIVCLFNVMRIESKYISVGDMFWFVYYLFFVIGPIQNVHNNYFDEGPVAGLHFLDGELIRAAAIPLLFALSATVASLMSGRRPQMSAQLKRHFVIDRRMVPLLTVIAFGSFCGLIITNGGPSGLMSRGFRSQLTIFPLVSLMISTFFILSIVIQDKATAGRIGMFEILACGFALFLLLLAQNPYNTARYFLLQAWLPVIFLIFRGRIRVSFFYIFLLFGLLVMLPILNLTSRYGADISRAVKSINIQEDFFHIPYIDVYDMLTYEIRYVGDMGFDLGMRTLGALLFFVPRAIWPGKPNLIALDMGELLTFWKLAGTANLSTFFGGEFYSDFGLLGVAILGLIFSWAYLNFFYNKTITINGFELQKFIILSAIPIVIRGPIGANAPLIFMELILFYMYTKLFGIQYQLARRDRLFPLGGT